MREKLKDVLIERAKTAQCISYKDLAAVLGICKSPIIGTVTKLLEELMEEDVAANRPILSSLAIQKSGKTLPRSGFFEKLSSLKVIDFDDNFNENIWHMKELERLKVFYKNKK